MNKKNNQNKDCPVTDIAEARSKTVTCVIIEDAAFVREVFRIVFKKTHIQVLAEASDGIEALIKLAEHKPDMALLDLVLPLKNGFDVLKEIERVSPKTKVIVVSSLDEPEFQRKAMALGALKYLKKPFTKKELLDAVAEITESYGETAHG